MGDVAPVCQEEDPAAAPSSGESIDLECPICYQEYNQHNKCPRMLECLHVFCTECLQRIQLTTHEPGGSSTSLAIPCPLCRHLTPSETGDALTLPCNSRILSRLPQVDVQTPASALATVTQRVVLSLDSNGRDSRFIILPTVSLRVQQMHPDRPYGAVPGLVSEQGVIQQSKKTLLCVQLLAVVFWVLFVITCVVGVVFGPHLFKKSF
ncbi:E3 ubiquitin-protein ligase RNF152 [Nothobranchius furzeri]|uniref:E3 ubiquitin-protein ligase RNF152-like n=1 Tax=Nothobranchius furzeri TaxID=105023 RepID=A0A8C6K8Q8_NOTFU|nr:E3 ubiquitin-protein ligase RNF152-like [Nothobranchius furzeri]